MTALPPVVVDRAGYSCWQRGVRWVWNRAPDIGVEFVASGNASFIQNGVGHIVSPGHAFLVRRGDTQQFEPGPAGYMHKRYVYLRGSVVDTLVQSLRLDTCDTIDCGTRPWFQPLFRRIATAMATPGESAAKTRHLTTLAFELLVELSHCHQAGALPPQVRAAMEFMDRNVSRSLTLKEVASSTGIGPQHLCRLFASSSNSSPLQYFLQRRVGYARTLLTETAMSVKEIAAHLGYEDPLYFSAQFKRVVGVSPRRFRAQWQASADPA